MRNVHVWGDGVVRIGARVRFDASVAPIELRAFTGAEIVIDDDASIESGVSIEALACVRIGKRATICAFAKILDGHFHALAGDRHARPDGNVVIVEDDVCVGPRSILLPRAHVGRGSILRAGTVISRRFPPGVVLGGAPASIRARLSELPR